MKIKILFLYLSATRGGTLGTFISILILCICKINATQAQEAVVFKKEIKNILDFIIKDEINDGLHIHVLVEDEFNDSTFLVEVWINSHTSGNKSNIDSLTYKGKKVYIYNIPAAKRADLQKLDISPFYVPDSKIWSILVLFRKAGTRILKVDFFDIFNEELNKNVENLGEY